VFKKLAGNISIYAIIRYSAFKTGIGYQRSNVIHFVLFIASMLFIKKSNI